MTNLKIYSVSVTTTGSAGSATGSNTVNITRPGELEFLYFDYHASTPATADVTVAYTAGAVPASNIIVRSNSTTDAMVFPRAGAVDAACAAITNSFVKVPVFGSLTVSVAQGDALTGAVVVYIGVSS